MNIAFQLEAQLRTIAGRSRFPLTLHAGATLEDGIRILADSLGDSPRGHLLQADGSVRSSLLIVVNGESIYSEEAREFPLREGAEILLMSPIAGG